MEIKKTERICDFCHDYSRNKCDYCGKDICTLPHSVLMLTARLCPICSKIPRLIKLDELLEKEK